MRNSIWFLGICFMLVKLSGATVAAQNTTVDWFSLASGGGRLNGSGTDMIAAVGEGLVGYSKGQNTVLTSGFLGGILTIGSVVGVSEQPQVPKAFTLSQNYPNPFNPSTTIRYGLPNKSAVQLTVFNTLGQQVAVLQNGEQDAGYHEVKFDSRNLSSGVYFYRIEAGSFIQTRKLLLIR